MTPTDQTPPPTGPEPTKPTYAQPITAPAVRSGLHFWKMIAIGLLVFGYAGCCFLYDGFVKYPAMNQRASTLDAQIEQLDKDHSDPDRLAQLTAERKTIATHDAFGMNLQKVIGGIAAPLGLYMIYRHLKKTSGAYVLADDVLSLPDGRHVPVDSITAVHDAKWEAKAIGTFDYRTPEGADKSFTLDALAFDTDPTDAIHDAIVQRVRSRTTPAANA